MKNSFLSKLLIGVLFTFAIASCDKESTSTTTTVDPNKKGVLTCKINGTLWQSEDNGSMAVMMDSNVLAVFGIKKNGSDSTFVVISLNLLPSKTGKYEGTANVLGGNYVLHYPSKSQNSQVEIAFNYVTTYTVNLTKYDMLNRRVSGTFSNIQKAPAGSGKPDYILTEGTFTDVLISY